MRKISIFYIDDHPVSRAGLKNLFRGSRDNICIQGEANSIENAICQAKTLSFDLFLLDLWLKTGDPLKNFQTLKQNFPNHPIVIYTGDRTSYWQRILYKFGAAAYIYKECEKNEIRSILQDVLEGKRCFRSIVENEQQKKMDAYRDSTRKLNSTEEKILKLLIEGNSSSEIASILNLDISTIDKGLKQIRKIFGVRNNIELVRAIMMST